MRIAINCRSCLNRNYTGIGRYTFNLIQFLSKIDQDNSYTLYCPVGIFDRKKVIPRVEAKNFSVQRDYFKRGMHNILREKDIVHLPSPDFAEPMESKLIVTIHDLVYRAFPEGHTQRTIELTDGQMKSFLPFVSKLICCSKNTMNDLKTYFGVPDNKMALVYQGVDHGMFYPLFDEEKALAQERLKDLGVDGPFLLFVGTIEPRKNLKNLLLAISSLKRKGKLKKKLVIAGMKGWKSQDIEQFIEQCGVKDDVIFLGFIGNDELRYLYNLCEIFVFPSFYEGFGYPLVEAFCCGAAVITSNAASCPEVASDAALKINPQSVDEMAQAIERISDDVALKAQLKQAALRRARDFSFHKTAEETLKVYKEVALE